MTCAMQPPWLGVRKIRQLNPVSAGEKTQGGLAQHIFIYHIHRGMSLSIAARSKEARGIPTQSHISPISPSVQVYKDKTQKDFAGREHNNLFAPVQGILSLSLRHRFNLSKRVNHIIILVFPATVTPVADPSGASPALGEQRMSQPHHCRWRRPF